jgi:spermidine synthase
MSWRTLDRARMTDGSEMTLVRRGDEHSIRIDGDVLMTSNSHGSEEKLAERGCAGLGALPRARVLVGGLGMGFTARAALSALRPDAVVDVVELVGAVVRWNRQLIGHLADAPLLDPRVRVTEGDVADAIATRSCWTSTTARKRSPSGKTGIFIRSRGSGVPGRH